jgi:hypothetical protein
MIVKPNNLEELPRSSTCSNVLFLPVYPDWNVLKDKLLKAISYAKGHYNV